MATAVAMVLETETEMVMGTEAAAMAELLGLEVDSLGLVVDCSGSEGASLVVEEARSSSPR